MSPVARFCVLEMCNCIDRRYLWELIWGINSDLIVNLSIPGRHLLNAMIDPLYDETIKEQIGAKKIDESKLKSLKPLTAEIVLPYWIKNNAEWWSTGQITNDDFSLGIEFMIKEGFIKVPMTEVSTEKSSDIPDWVKNNAGWWSEGMISDIDFVNGLQFLISNGIINVA